MDGQNLKQKKKQRRKLKVFVAMSGGVDSSVTAALMKEQGHEVTGVYMKNWTKSFPGMRCPWEDDVADAKRVAVQLGVPFEIIDFQKGYRHKVVDYMIDAFKRGLTPNPDITCNQEIKFKLFLETALESGADLIATGHYARVIHDSENSQISSTEPQTNSKFQIPNSAELHMAKDENKDQTYFLYRVSEEALKKTVVPLGDYTKTQVRKMAKDRNLATAGKKDSVGICFIGEVGIKDFLGQYVKTEPGPIVNQKGKEIGQHDGAIFYTIGQRHGLHVGGGLPYYVTAKDMESNTVFVTTDLNDKKLWSDTAKITQLHWINDPPDMGTKYKVRVRHQGELIGCEATHINKIHCSLKLDNEVRALAPGQSAVVYEGSRVLGGGILTS